MHALFCLLALGAAPPNGFLRELPGVRRLEIRLSCFALSPDGKTAFGGGQMRVEKPSRYWAEVRHWDLSTGKLLRAWKLAGGDVENLAISPDGKRVLAIVQGPILCSWDVNGGSIETLRWTSRSGPFSLCVADGAKVIALSTERGATLLDPRTGNVKKRLELQRSMYRTGRVSPDGNTFARTNHQDLDLWNIASGKRVRSHLDHDGRVVSPAFSQNGRWLAYLTELHDEKDVPRCRAFVRESATGKLVCSVRLEGELWAQQVAVSANGKLVAILGTAKVHGPGRLFVYDIATGGELARVEYGPVHSWTIGLAFSRDGKTLAVCLRDSIRVYRVGGRR
jgi:WD40 repeat protein